METTIKKISDVCSELNITRQTLYNWKKRDLITFIKSPTGGTFILIDEKYNKIKLFYDGSINKGESI